MLRASLVVMVVLSGLGCAHAPLSSSALSSIQKPAYVARVAHGAGPFSHVFVKDGSYASRLNGVAPAEADTRLVDRLAHGVKDPKSGQLIAASVTPFEISESFREEVLSQLPNDNPLKSPVAPTQVSTVLESLLVQEVSAAEPDLSKLKSLGVDAVVELVVESYGLRSENGRAGIYLEGTARVVRLDGGVEYQRRFFSDELHAGFQHLDPFEVAKNPALFRERLKNVLASVAEVIARDLSAK